MSMDTIDWARLALRPGQRLLDLGCGEGRHSIGAAMAADIDVVGLDLGRDDLATARQRWAESAPWQPPGRTHFTCGSGLTLPFADASFDVVVCSEVLEHVTDYGQVLNEIARVVRPGGQVAVSVPRAWPERLCWWLSSAYHRDGGGHIRIFRAGDLRRAVAARGLAFRGRHWAHALHVPYWWLRCLFAGDPDNNMLVRAWHRLLVWDLMERPPMTRTLERWLNPLCGKSVVLYFDAPGPQR